MTRKSDVVTALEALKAITIELKNALLLGHLDDFGALLHEAWTNKKQLAAPISNSHIEELYRTARAHGALGGKISGAGGGGFLLTYSPLTGSIASPRLWKRRGVPSSLSASNRVACRHGPILVEGAHLG